MNFVKLSETTNFTIEKVWGYKFKKWDEQNKKMLVSDSWMEGYSKRWDIDTDKGKLDLSNQQFAQILTACFDNKSQISSVAGKTFTVKTNGKSGMDIRYFINLARNVEPKKMEFDEEEIDTESIPF